MQQVAAFAYDDASKEANSVMGTLTEVHNCPVGDPDAPTTPC